MFVHQRHMFITFSTISNKRVIAQEIIKEKKTIILLKLKLMQFSFLYKTFQST